MTKVRHKNVGYGQRPPFFHFFSFFQKEVDFGHFFCPSLVCLCLVQEFHRGFGNFTLREFLKRIYRIPALKSDKSDAGSEKVTDFRFPDTDSRKVTAKVKKLTRKVKKWWRKVKTVQLFQLFRVGSRKVTDFQNPGSTFQLLGHFFSTFPLL